MTRIVAGAAGGRRLAVPAGRSTRPTADRTREALFSSLASLLDIEEAGVLDLYAGSGAIGLEAASRGAREVLIVENARPALAAIRRNLAELRLPAVAVEAASVERMAATRAPHSYQLAIADPPYAMPAQDLAAVLADLDKNGWLDDGAVVVVERSSRDKPWVWPGPLTAIRDRTYGECTLWYGRRIDSGPREAQR